MEVPFHASALMLEAPNTTQDILIRLRRGQFWRQTRAFFQCFLVKKKKKGTLTNNLFTLDVYILFFCHLLFLILRLSLKKKSGLCGNFIIKGYILSAKIYAQATVT